MPGRKCLNVRCYHRVSAVRRGESLAKCECDPFEDAPVDAANPSYNEQEDGADYFIEQVAAFGDGGGMHAAGIVGWVSAESGRGAG